MNKFSGNFATCPKCGANGISTHYDRSRDRMKRTCTSCSYSWSELPLDASGPRKSTEDVFEKMRKMQEQADKERKECPDIECAPWVTPKTPMPNPFPGRKPNPWDEHIKPPNPWKPGKKAPKYRCASAERFTRSIDGFSPGTLAHPRLYLNPEKTYGIVSKEDQEYLVRMGQNDPLPEYAKR